MPIKIDKNVPIPPRRRGPGRASQYPWHEMEPGDSFWIDKPQPKMTGAVSAAATWFFAVTISTGSSLGR